MTGLVPFLLLPAALVLARAKNPIVVGCARGLLAASVLLTGLVTLVNYIPDTVSEPLFGVVLPLARRGDLVPSVLTFLGVPNPWSGALFVVAIAVFAAWVLLARTGAGRVSPPGAIGGVAVIAAVLALHLAVYRADPGTRAPSTCSRAPGWLPRG